MSQTKVLCVEDDVATREALAEALESRGYHVDSAGSAAEGLLHLRRTHYELVVTDFSMPGSTGTAMLEQAAEEGLLEGSKALLITAHHPENPFNVEVFRKPIDLQNFLGRVKELLDPEAARTSPSAPVAETGATFFVDSDALERIDAPARRILALRLDELNRRGTALYGWSSKGSQVARRFAESLGIAHCFQAFLPKPTALISETPISAWKLAEHASGQLASLSVEDLLHS